MNLTHKILIERLNELHLISPNNTPITFPEFKNRVLVYEFEDGNKAVFFGIIKKYIFGFYSFKDDDKKRIREAHRMYIRLVNGDFYDFDNGLITIHEKIPKKYFANSENNLIFAS